MRDGKAEGFSGLEIDDKVEFRRLLNRQVRRLGALEDLVDVTSCTSPDFIQVRAVRDQSTGLDIRQEVIHGGKSARRGQLYDALTVRVLQLAGDHQKTARARVSRFPEGQLKLACPPNLKRQELPGPALAATSASRQDKAILGSQSTAIGAAPGTSSFSNSSRFPVVSIMR